MDDAVRRALEIDHASPARDRTIDITTTGARSGEPRRIETWFYRVDGRIYLSGLPGRRGWYANLLANPAFTFHLKHGVQADLAAVARTVPGEAERRRILTQILDDLNGAMSPARSTGPAELEKWLAGSPLIEVELAG
ncbi:MAG TPA: nitroreductase/quinone reductase family protein [Gaiellales bacterium]|jgi:deazaflavin-dependent oxidoreductase (nitroreductase family)